MKFALLALLTISCAPLVPQSTGCRGYYACELERCMERFSRLGYSSDAVIKMCKTIYERD